MFKGTTALSAGEPDGDERGLKAEEADGTKGRLSIKNPIQLTNTSENLLNN